MEIFVVIALLQVADAFTTYKVLKKGGYEANPLLVFLQKTLSKVTNAKWAWLVIAKLVAAVAGWYACVHGVEYGIAVAVFYVIVVSNNIRVLRKM